MARYRFASTFLMLVALLGVAVPPPASAARQNGGSTQERPDPPISATGTLQPVTVSVAMLASHIRNIAGLPVEVFGGEVSEVVSARMFILAHSGPRLGRDRVAVLLERGEAIVPGEAPVVVTGTARTPLGGRLAAPAIFTTEELDAIDDLAVVLASDVRTPGGISLVQL